jgi:SAM-dependent methyltransferase
MTAVDAWREQLRSWAIPDDILRAAPEPPYGYPREPFEWRGARAGVARDSPTTARAAEALGDGAGTVLDIGVGGGGTSLPLRELAATIIGVDASSSMLDAFTRASGTSGAATTGVLGTWPDVSAIVPSADVVTCGHVLYNVHDIAPFVHALQAKAHRRVVFEITQRHPWAWMRDLWLRFHGLDRPRGPTAEDALAALAELGIRAATQERRAEGHTGFERREDAVALVRRRLCLSASRDLEVEDALGDRLSRREDRWSAGPLAESLVTLWWDVTPLGSLRTAAGPSSASR